MTRKRDRSRGQGLVEFALVFPVLAVLIFGIIDFGRAIFIYSVVQDAAREGARYAIVHGSQSQSIDGLCASGPGASCDPSGANVAARSRQYSYGLDPSQLTTGACWGFGCTVSSDCTSATNTAATNAPLIPVTVASCYGFNTIIGSLLPIGRIPLRAQATLVINH